MRPLCLLLTLLGLSIVFGDRSAGDERASHGPEAGLWPSHVAGAAKQDETPEIETEADPEPEEVPADDIEVEDAPVVPGALAPPLPPGVDPATYLGDEAAEPFQERRTLDMLGRLHERAAEGRWAETAAVAQAILDLPHDSAVPVDERRDRSVRAVVHELIGGLPPEGLRSYELQFGPAARQLLQRAGARSEVLAEVVGRFRQTVAGAEALAELAAWHFDHGHYSAAARRYEELLAHPQSPVPLTPALHVRVAAAYAAAGDRDRAREQLEQAMQLNGGRPLVVAGAPLEPDAWLAEIATQRPLGGRGPGGAAGSEDWLVFRGAADRNARAAGTAGSSGSAGASPRSDAVDPHAAAPFLQAEWSAEIDRSGNSRRGFEQLLETARRSDVALHVASYPLAVDGRFLVRTRGHVRAIGAATGDLQWRETAGRGMTQTNFVPNPSGSVGNGFAAQMVADTVGGMLSSDGRLLFSVQDSAVRSSDGSWSNRVVAYDLATGDERWHTPLPPPATNLRLPQPQEPPDDVLVGMFFLGAPLPLDGALYAIGEANAELQLVALDTEDGRRRWSLPLALVRQTVDIVAPRRLHACPPASSEGILVCPTDAGLVVAVDAAARSVLWAYRYGDPEMPPVEVLTLAALENWVDATPILSRGRVILAPNDSLKIHCLDLQDGRELWSVPRDTALYVAGVFGEQVVVIGRGESWALDLADGRELWRTPAGRPAGFGYAAGGTYVLPLVDGEVVWFALEDGTVLGRARGAGETQLGNLLPYRGRVLSVRADRAVAFPQRGALQRQLEEVVAEDPNEPVALRTLAVMARETGDLQTAAALLRRSRELEPKDLTRHLLLDVLLEQLASDFVGREEVRAEIEALVEDDDAGRARYLELVVDRLQSLGRPQEALAAYRALLNLGGDYRPPPLGVLEGHQRTVSSVTLWHEPDVAPPAQRGEPLSGDGDSRLVALSASYDGTLRLWDVGQRRELQRIRVVPMRVTSAAVSPDRRFVFCGGSGAIARLWDVADGTPVQRFEGHSRTVYCAAFSHDGRRAVTGDGRTVRVWDVATGAELGFYGGHEAAVLSVAFSPDDSRVVSADESGAVHLWHSETGQRVLLFTGHRDAVFAVAFSPDATRLVSGGADGTLRLWHVETGQEVLRLDGHSNRVACAVFTPDGRRVVSGSDDYSVRLWDAESGQQLVRFDAPRSVACLAVSPDGNYALSGGGLGTLLLWGLPE